MRVKVSFMDPDGFDRFVVPPPKVILNSNDRDQLENEKSTLSH